MADTPATSSTGPPPPVQTKVSGTASESKMLLSPTAVVPPSLGSRVDPPSPKVAVNFRMYRFPFYHPLWVRPHTRVEFLGTNLYRHIWALKDCVEHDPDDMWGEEEEEEEEEEEDSEFDSDSEDSDGNPKQRKKRDRADTQLSDWDRRKAPKDERAAYSKRLALMLYRLWEMTWRKSHQHEALAALRVAMARPRNLDDSSLRELLSRLYLRDGNLDAAGLVFESTIYDYAKDTRVWTNLLSAAAIHRRVGKFEDAAKLLMKLGTQQFAAPFAPVDAVIQLAWTWELQAENNRDFDLAGKSKLAYEKAHGAIVAGDGIPDFEALFADGLAKEEAARGEAEEAAGMAEEEAASKLEQFQDPHWGTPAQRLRSSLLQMGLLEQFPEKDVPLVAEAEVAPVTGSPPSAARYVEAFKAAAQHVPEEIELEAVPEEPVAGAGVGGAEEEPTAEDATPLAVLSPSAKKKKKKGKGKRKGKGKGEGAGKGKAAEAAAAAAAAAAEAAAVAVAAAAAAAAAAAEAAGTPPPTPPPPPPKPLLPVSLNLVANWRSTPYQWFMWGNYYLERHAYVVASDCFMEALRLSGIRLRESEEMGRRPGKVKNPKVLRDLEHTGWETMTTLMEDMDETRFCLPGQSAPEKADMWFHIMRCAMLTADPSLAAFANMMHRKYLDAHRATFKFEDRAFLKLVGHGDWVRRQDLRAVFWAGYFIPRCKKRVKWRVKARRMSYLINAWYRWHFLRWRLTLRMPARIKMTTCARGWLQRRRYREKKAASHHGALKLQCLWRRYLARLELIRRQIAWDKLCNKSATTLNAFGRMKAARLEFCDQRGAAVVLQCFYRKWVVARKDWDRAVDHRAAVHYALTDAGTDDSPQILGSLVLRRSYIRRNMAFSRLRTMARRFYVVPNLRPPTPPDPRLQLLADLVDTGGDTARSRPSTGRRTTRRSTPRAGGATTRRSGATGRVGEGGGEGDGDTAAKPEVANLDELVAERGFWSTAVEDVEVAAHEVYNKASLKVGGAGLTLADTTVTAMRSWQPSMQEPGGNAWGVNPVFVAASMGDGVHARLLPDPALDGIPTQWRAKKTAVLAADREAAVRAEYRARKAVLRGEAGTVAHMLKWMRWDQEARLRDAGKGMWEKVVPTKRSLKSFPPAYASPRVSFAMLTRVRKHTLRTWQLKVRLKPRLVPAVSTPTSSLSPTPRSKGSGRRSRIASAATSRSGMFGARRRLVPTLASVVTTVRPTKYWDTTKNVPNVDVTYDTQYMDLSNHAALVAYVQHIVPPDVLNHTSMVMFMPRPHGRRLMRQRYVWRLAVDEAHAVAQTKALPAAHLEMAAKVAATGGGIGYFPVRAKPKPEATVANIPDWYNAGRPPTPPDPYAEVAAALAAAEEEAKAKAHRGAPFLPVPAVQVANARRVFGATQRPPREKFGPKRHYTSIAEVTGVRAGLFPGFVSNRPFDLTRGVGGEDAPGGLPDAPHDTKHGTLSGGAQTFGAVRPAGVPAASGGGGNWLATLPGATGGPALTVFQRDVHAQHYSVPSLASQAASTMRRTGVGPRVGVSAIQAIKRSASEPHMTLGGGGRRAPLPDIEPPTAWEVGILPAGGSAAVVTREDPGHVYGPVTVGGAASIGGLNPEAFGESQLPQVMPHPMALMPDDGMNVLVSGAPPRLLGTDTFRLTYGRRAGAMPLPDGFVDGGAAGFAGVPGRTCFEAGEGQAKGDYKDKLVGIARETMGWFVKHPGVWRELLICRLEDLLRLAASAHHARCSVESCEWVASVTELLVRCLKRPMKYAEDIVHAMQDLAATWVLSHGGDAVAKRRAEAMALSALRAELAELGAGYRTVAPTSAVAKTYRGRFAALLLRELKVRKWGGVQEVLNTMAPLRIFPPTSTMVRVLKVCAVTPPSPAQLHSSGRAPPSAPATSRLTSRRRSSAAPGGLDTTSSMSLADAFTIAPITNEASPLSVALTCAQAAATAKAKLSVKDMEAVLATVKNWGVWTDVVTVFPLLDRLGLKPSRVFLATMVAVCGTAPVEQRAAVFDCLKALQVPLQVCYKAATSGLSEAEFPRGQMLAVLNRTA